MLLIPGPVPPKAPAPGSPDQPPLPGLAAAGMEWSSSRGPVPRDQAVARAARLVHSFGVLVLEVWQGRRPPHQLDNAMAPHLAVAVLADSSLASGQPRLARVHACLVSETAIEGVLIVEFRGRVAAVTLRLERGLSTWWCSHYHLVRTTHRRAHRRRSAVGNRDRSAGLGGLAVTGLELAT